MTAARYMADLALLAHHGHAQRRWLNRRDVMRLGAGAGSGLVPGLLARPRGARAQAFQIIVATFGGDAPEAWQQAWGNPFRNENGRPVGIYATEPTPAAIRAQVRTENVVWDCVDGDLFQAPMLGAAGLIQRYDYARVDRRKVRPEFATEWGCSAYLYSTVNVYDRNKTGGRIPRGYRDYLNFREFPGKRAMYKWLVGSLEAVLVGGGADPAKLYPLDVERAFALIRDHKDQFLLWGGGISGEHLFRSGAVAMGCLWSSRALVLDRQTGGRLTWTWDHGVVAPGALHVLVDNPAGRGVFDFIASTQDPERQVELLKLLGTGTANPEAGELETDAQQRVDPGHQANYRRQIPIDVRWYAENYDRVQERFLELMAG